mgnify:FL=1
MLQAFRNHKRWLMFIAMVLIIPSFVVTGIYSYNRMTQADNSIAKVGDASITPEDFDRAKREQLERFRQQLGENFRANMLESPEAREAIVRALMDESAVTQTVLSEYVDVSEADAINLIKNAAALQVDGKFSPELYERFLQSQGKSDAQFVAEIRRDLSKEVLLSGVAGTYPVPQALVRELHNVLTEEREVQTFIVNATDYLDALVVKDEESKAYYDAHRDEFMAPEHVKIQYVEFSPENFRDQKPNPDEIKAYYEQNKNRWIVPEERRASHILIEFGDDKAAALKTAEKLLAEAKADPSKFAELAKANSADTGSANDGGDLSFFGRGLMVKPFEDAVYAANKGDIVGPVESEFGYHIIYVTDIRPEHGRSFEEVKGEIEHEYVEQMAIREFSEKAEEFTNIVYEQPDSLDPAAERFGLKIETVDNVTREGVTDPELRPIITEHLVESLFGEESLKEKRNTNAIEVRSNVLVSARVLEYFPTAVRPYEDVKAQIVEKLKLERARELAKADGEKKLAEVRASKSLEGFAEPVRVSRQKTQGQPVELIDAEISYPAEKLPAFVGTQVEGGAYIIAYVKDSKLVEPTEAQIRSLTSELAGIYGEADRIGYLEALKATLNARIENEAFVKGETQPNEE